jgi:hypothetical protein
LFSGVCTFNSSVPLICIRSNTTRQSQQYQPFTIEHQLITYYISIPEDGEFFAEGLQGLHIEFCCGDAYRIVSDRSEGLALGIYYNSASVIMTVRVVPYPVDAYHKTLILQSSRLQENVPHSAATLWPVGYVYHCIV